MPFITEAVRLLVAELGATPLIGFAGAPFTLASYLVEGGPSKNHVRTKALMHGDPGCGTRSAPGSPRSPARSCGCRPRPGASAVQLFDSWAGALSKADYTARAMPHSAVALAAVADLDVPRIHFGVGTGELLQLMGEAGADVVGVDYRTSLTDAVDRLGPTYAVQGNLDPALLFAPWEALERRVREIVEEGRRRARPHLQPRARGAARGRPRRADARHRTRPRVLEPPMTLATAPSVARSSLTMFGGSVASRVLGVVRNGLITAIIGASFAGDAFSLANTLPNVLYVLAAGGILNAVLIPSLARAMKLEDGGQEFTDRVITVALTGMAVITLAVMAGAGGFV